MLKHLLPLIPEGLLVRQILPTSDSLVIVAASRGGKAACPDCGAPSTVVHSRYERHLGLALGGEAGARLAARLAVPISADTLLRMLRRQNPPLNPDPPPRVLGVDDWAWRRGRRYGSILVDLERNRVLDLLPDRQAETLKNWLQRHPGITVVARDRACAYADGARQGAPDAVQVADRWHLLRNLGEALEAVVERHHAVIRRIGKDVAAAVAVPAMPSAARQCQEARHPWRQARYKEAARLHAAGTSISQVARQLGADRKTLHRWLRAGAAQAGPCRGAAASWIAIAPFWSGAGPRAAITLPGCGGTAAQWLCRSSLGCQGLGHRETQDRARRMPTPCTNRRSYLAATHASLRHAPADGERRDTHCTGPRLRHAPAGRGTRAASNSGCRKAHRPPAAAAERRQARCGIGRGRRHPLASFVAELRKDTAAVQAALELPWSTSPVEGQINWLKMIKRTMYGRAGFALLRARVLQTACPHPAEQDMRESPIPNDHQHARLNALPSRPGSRSAICCPGTFVRDPPARQE
ncbi:ISL3 family transposase [Pseudoroseomonas wenyumeiae]